MASKEWKQAGDLKYIFLHGHQFDKMFRRVGPLRRFPGLVAGLASFLDSHVGKGTGPVSLIIFSILLFLTATNWMNALAVIGQLLPILWIVTGLFGIAGFSWLWTKLQKPAWKYLFKKFADRPINKDIGTIVDENYYDCNKDYTLSESVIVFGHTHVPDIAIVQKHSIKAYWKKCREGSGKKTFINSGAWVKPSVQEEGAKVTPNTLVYIDEEGPLLLQWDDVKKEVLYYVPASRGKYSVLKTK